METKAQMSRDEIKRELERCGFTSGERFSDAAEVRKYLSVEVQAACFGIEADQCQDRLDEMADWVIANHYHMD